MKLVNSDCRFIKIGKGKRVHIGVVSEYCIAFAYALCSVGGGYNIVFDPKEKDVCKSCLRIFRRDGK